MKQINVLIATKDELASDMMKYGIKKFNSESDSHEFVVQCDSCNSEHAFSFLKNSIENPIQLILLDDELDGEIQTFEISKRYPDRAYIIITQKRDILRIIYDAKKEWNVNYMAHITGGGNYNIERIVIALNGYLSFAKI